MTTTLQKNYRVIFYGLWLLLGLLQSGLTELQDDEAYYWVYSKYPDWGYFDHPPLTALLIKAGYAIFPNEIGVRLLPLLMNVGSLMLIEKLTDQKNPLLFYCIILSVAALQLVGYMAVPDIPLIFFTALFFFCFRRFLEMQNLFNSFLLGFAIALFFYTKYHAVIVVVFALLSQIRLFKRYYVWLAGFIAFLLFAPHLWWQYQHDWVSFKYHLFESNVNNYRISFTLDYILSQILLAGPIAGFILLPAALLFKPKTDLQKALRYSLFGIYGFFLLSSFRGKVEANWTAPVLVPIIILSYVYVKEKLQWRKWLFRLLPYTLIIVLVARIMLIEDILPLKAVKERYHSWKEWPAEMKTLTRSLPVVFENSYQRASKYWFYTGQMTYSQNLYTGRKNNFNFWPIEDSMLGKPVYLMDLYALNRFSDSLITPLGWIGYKFDSSFTSFAKINIAVKPKHFSVRGDEKLQIQCLFELPEHYKKYIRVHSLNDTIIIGVFDKSTLVKEIPTSLKLNHIVDSPAQTLSIEPGLPKGKYNFRFAIGVKDYYPTHNSENIKLTVE